MVHAKFQRILEKNKGIVIELSFDNPEENTVVYHDSDGKCKSLIIDTDIISGNNNYIHVDDKMNEILVSSKHEFPY